MTLKSPARFLCIAFIFSCFTSCINDNGEIANATLTIDTSIKRQYVRGFGAMDTPGDQNFSAIPAEHFDKLYNPDTGLALNILRIYIPPVNPDIRAVMKVYTSHTRPQYYAQIKKVNEWGGYVFASPWSPPGVWKNNGSANGDNSVKGEERTAFLKSEHYQDYAAYLKEFCHLMTDNYAPIYAISIQNEPNYSEAAYPGCMWSGEEMRDFLKTAGRFTEGTIGYGGGRALPFVKIMNGESANTPSVNDAALDDPQSREAIDLLGRHLYGELSGTGSRYEKAFEYGKELWMTEHCVNDDHQRLVPGAPPSHENTAAWNHVWRFMNDIDHVIRINEMSAYTAYPLRRFYSLMGDDARFGSPGAGEILPRGYGISHYAKFAKETWNVAVSASGKTKNGKKIKTGGNFNNTEISHGSTAVKASAFESPDGSSISVVMWTPTDINGSGGIDMGLIRIKLPKGFAAKTASAMRSSIVNNGKTADEAVTLGDDGASALVALPAGNILSVRFTRQADTGR